MPKVGGKRKKARSHKEPDEELEKEMPKIFVIRKGQAEPQIPEVVHDLRRCFYPNTAMKLEDGPKINLKAYLKTAKQFNVTHMVVLQQNNSKTFMRILKMGGGEMRFRIINYCRMKDVYKNGGQPFSFTFKNPLVVMNGFGTTSQMKMLGRAIQSMFPPINPQKIKTQHLKRVICFSYSPNKKVIYFRHYKIVTAQGGVDKSFANLLEHKSMDLSKFTSIGQYLASLNSSPPEAEEANQNQQKVKLVQIGPRFKLKFMSYTQKSGHMQEQEGQQMKNEPNVNEEQDQQMEQ